MSVATVIGTRGNGSVSAQIADVIETRRMRLQCDRYLTEHRNGFGCGSCWIETGKRDTPAPCLHFVPHTRSPALVWAIRGALMFADLVRYRTMEEQEA